MIKIFNKQRKQLVDEDKFGRYLKYAIGEIILVVIGILIALQINNWSEDRKKAINIKMALHELRNNLVADSLMMKGIMLNLKEDLVHQQQLIHAMETGEVLDSSYNEHLGRVIIMRRANVIRNGYDTIKELGFENINDTHLRNSILFYYNSLIFQLLKDIEDDEDEFKTLLLPFIRENFVDWKFGSYGIPRSYEELSRNGEFEIVLRINYLNRRSTMDRLEEASKELNRIISLIEQYRHYNYTFQ